MDLSRVLNQNRHQMSGQLSKYTNVMKGKEQKKNRLINMRNGPAGLIC